MTEQTRAEEIAELRAGIKAIRHYGDRLGVDSTFDHDGQWWDGYRQAQRSFIFQTRDHAEELQKELDQLLAGECQDTQ